MQLGPVFVPDLVNGLGLKDSMRAINLRHIPSQASKLNKPLVTEDLLRQGVPQPGGVTSEESLLQGSSQPAVQDCPGGWRAARRSRSRRTDLRSPLHTDCRPQLLPNLARVGHGPALGPGGRIAP